MIPTSNRERAVLILAIMDPKPDPLVRNSNISIVFVLRYISPAKRHGSAIALVDDAFEVMPAGAIALFHDALAEPDFWPCLEPRTREDLALIARGHIMLRSIHSARGLGGLI